MAVNTVKRIFLWMVLVLLGLYLVVLVTFQLWKFNYFSDLEAGSEVIQTARGAVEYASKGEGPVLLVLHGTPGSYDQGMFLARELVPQGFRIVAVSRPGYLRTPAATGLTLSDQADAYAALLDALNLGRVAVVGGSGGGPAAIEMAIRHPERLWAGVHLFGLAGGLPAGDDEPAPPPPLLQRILHRLFGEGFMEWLLLNLNRLFPEDLLFSAGMGMINDDARARLFGDEEKLDRFDAMLWTGYTPRREPGRQNDIPQFGSLDQSRANEIRIPMLFIHGDDDNNAPYRAARELAARIPGAEFHTVPGADHWMAITRPEDVYPPLIDFLKRHAPAVQ